MMKNQFSIEEKLVGYIHELYEACKNPNKSEKCLCFDDPSDIPCRCPHMAGVRQQIKFLAQKQKSEVN